MAAARWIRSLLEDAADDVVRWAERQFADLADTPANRQVVQRGGKLGNCSASARP